VNIKIEIVQIVDRSCSFCPWHQRGFQRSVKHSLPMKKQEHGRTQSAQRIIDLFSALRLAEVCLVVAIGLSATVGCHKKADKNLDSGSRVKFGSDAWNKAAAENVCVDIISVLQTPGAKLVWREDRPTMALSRDEKAIIESHGVTGELEVVLTTGRGSGSVRVRVVVIQNGPIEKNVQLPVPESGSYIYVEKGKTLVPLSTNRPPSTLMLEVVPEKGLTAFYLNYPRDRVRSGGTLFLWEDDGRFRPF
jgi:hypothetical protein